MGIRQITRCKVTAILRRPQNILSKMLSNTLPQMIRGLQSQWEHCQIFIKYNVVSWLFLNGKYGILPQNEKGVYSHISACRRPKRPSSKHRLHKYFTITWKYRYKWEKGRHLAQSYDKHPKTTMQSRQSNTKTLKTFNYITTTDRPRTTIIQLVLRTGL